MIIKMNKRIVLSLITLFLFSLNLLVAQDTRYYNLSIQTTDKETNERLIGATVLYQVNLEQKGTITDTNGEVSLKLPEGNTTIKISYIGYLSQEYVINIQKDRRLLISLQPDSKLLDEVIVTATESKGVVTASKIDTKAMAHLQPSSFTDVLSLLPGGISSDPNMGSMNAIRLREANSLGANYDFSSLGTAFVVDDVPLSNDANLQSIAGNKMQGRENTSKGVDMRSISTDNIESIEIIRGIPSVQYGDVSTGVVKIKRKAKASPLELRFKADQYSKLFYIGKGIALTTDKVLNINVDYLDSKVDPRNKFENFKRLTTSVRYNQNFLLNNGGRIRWSSSLDLGSTFDNWKSDPEVDEKLDRYKTQEMRLSFNNELRYTTTYDKGLRNISFTPAISGQFNQIKQTKEVFLNLPSAVPSSTTEGSHDAIYLPYHYISKAKVDGKPINAFLRLNSVWATKTWSGKHLIRLGGDFRYEKNLGEGQVYDVTRPPSPNMSSRPRKYNDIPGLQKASFYIEDNITIPFIGARIIDLQAGLRGIALLNMNRNYLLNGKLHLDPRINFMVDAMNQEVAGKNLRWRIGGGWGILTKLPTIDQLYPNLVYTDLEELNYFHNNPEYRRLVLNTHIYDPTNYKLKANRNMKWEVRTDVTWNNYNLSVTYFKERTTSGFRTMSDYRVLPYRKYNTSELNSQTITAPPSLEELPYTNEHYLTVGGYSGNGSELNKEGIEFHASTPRYKSINTRITLSGAWFKTTYNNSLPEWYKPNVTINGKDIPYLGLYDYNEKKSYQSLNTSLMFDTHIPILGLIFSTTIQAKWYNRSLLYPKNTMPTSYIGIDGVVHPYTEAEANDPILKQLMLRENSTMNSRVPFESIINFKANKAFGKRLNIALFVNKLLSYTPSYKRNSITIYRSVSPYFGMELNIKI